MADLRGTEQVFGLLFFFVGTGCHKFSADFGLGNEQVLCHITANQQVFRAIFSSGVMMLFFFFFFFCEGGMKVRKVELVVSL